MDTQTILALIARHALTTAAGFLVAHGYLNSSGTEQFIAAGMLLAGVVWSWWQKTGQAKVAADLARLKARHGPPVSPPLRNPPTTAADVRRQMDMQKAAGGPK